MPVYGGTDLMVELNFDTPPAVRAARPHPRRLQLATWAEEAGRVRIGAGVTYTRTIAELGARLPGLALASRTVGSPQIRNRGTVGGNLGTASPAGDATRPCSPRTPSSWSSRVRGSRAVPVEEFFTGVKRNASSRTS